MFISLGILRCVPRQQILHDPGIRHIRILGLLQQPGQVSIGIQTILNGRLDQAKHNCAAGCSLRSVGKQEVLAVNDEGLNASFCPVVGDLQPAVFKVIGQVRPPLFQVSECLSQGRH